MKRRKILLVLTMAMFTLSGCVSVPKPIYTPPEQTNNTDKYQIILDQPFDEVWKKLIQYSAKTFFSIDNYEKQSGLITLSFGSADPVQFITGGRLYWELPPTVKFPTPGGYFHIFDGDIVEYLRIYYDGTLDGKMNIAVTSLDKNKTKVAVHARYIFITANNTWVFDSGSCCTVIASGKTKGVTICPTYLAEKSILSALK